MEEQKFTEETDKIVLEVINGKILRHTIQFFRKGAKRLEPFGSGVFAKIYNQYFIITASHVADFFETNPKDDLSVRVGKNRYVNIFGDIQYTDMKKSEGIDIAYIKLDKQLIEPLSKPYIPIEMDKFRDHNNLFNAMNYCVLGYPAKNVTKEDEDLDTGASFYLTSPSKDNIYNYYQYDKLHYIIVDMLGKGVDIKTNTKQKIDIRFHGISGCGLWLLLFHTDKEGKTVIDYRLVGIMTEYKQGKFFCLVGNKIKFIVEAFKKIENFKFREMIVQY